MSDTTPNQTSKFRTKNLVEINDDSRGTYNFNSQIKFKTTMLMSSLCDYSNAYILVNISRENFLHSRKMELSNSNVETFLIFSQKKAALISQETENPKICFILSQKKAFVIFRKTETPNSFFVFQEIEFLKSENTN